MSVNRRESRESNNGNCGHANENGRQRIVIERPLFSQQDFDQTNSYPPLGDSVRLHKRLLKQCECSVNCFLSFLKALFPFYGIMKKYKVKVDLVSDVIAGLTVAIMTIPQSMAYSLLATLPPVYGLYVSFFPVIIYFFMGSSRHISIGTFAVTSLMVGAVADKGFAKSIGSRLTGLNSTSTPTLTSPNDTTLSSATTNGDGGTGNVLEPIRLEYAIIVTFVAGMVQMLMGICRLGFMMTYLSDPVITGFTTAAAFHVFISQVSHVFGLKLQRNNGILKFPKTVVSVFWHIDETNLTTLAISAVAMVTLLLVKECINKRFKRLKVPVPIELIVVVVMTVTSSFLSLDEEHQVDTVGYIAKGIPPPEVPNFRNFGEVATDAVAIAIVGFAVNVSLAKMLSRNRYDINPNQELIASGSCNLFGSFFNSFFSSASLSRSLVQESVGGKTQVTGLVSCCVLLAVLLKLGPYFSYLPKCILASIIIVNLKRMFMQFQELPSIWRTSKYDFTTWIVTWLASVVLDIDIGLGIGLLFSFLTVLVRTQRAPVCVLGRVPHTDLYRDINTCSTASQIAGVKIIRPEASLYFVNAESFKQAVFRLCAVDPQRELKLREKAAKKQEESRKTQEKLEREREKSEHKETKKKKVPTGHSDVIQRSDCEESRTDHSPASIYSISYNKRHDIELEHTSKHSPTSDSHLPTNGSLSDQRHITDATAGTCETHASRNTSQQQQSNDADVPRSDVIPMAMTTKHHSYADTDDRACLRYIVIDCSMVCFMDSVGVKILAQMMTGYDCVGIRVYLASCQAGIRDVMDRSTFYDSVSKGRLFLTVHDAVIRVMTSHPDILSQIIPELQYSMSDSMNNQDGDARESHNVHVADCNCNTQF